jgi:ribonuclease Z
MIRMMMLSAIVALCLNGESAASQVVREKHRDSTVVILLGTGTPVPDPSAMGPATLIVYGDREFLFDAGVGVERQLAKAKLSFVNIEAVFLTHLHSDHILGLPDVIFTSWIFGRRTPLKVYGPYGTTNMSAHLIAAFAEDKVTRTKGPEHSIPGGYRVRAKDIDAGLVYDSAGVRVRAVAVPHNTGRPAFAYRIDTPDRSIVISGDTGPSDVLVSFARNVDVLVHEVVNVEEFSGKMPSGADARTYMGTAHTPAPKLGQIAARAHPGILVLSHIVPTGTDEKTMITAVRSGGYQGRIAFGRDLDRF